MQTVKHCEDLMQICLNKFQRNLVNMAECFGVVRHFEQACEQPAGKKGEDEKKRPVGMANDFDF